jgi:hypothetical protein
MTQIDCFTLHGLGKDGGFSVPTIHQTFAFLLFHERVTGNEASLFCCTDVLPCVGNRAAQTGFYGLNGQHYKTEITSTGA